LQRLSAIKDEYDISFACDTDHDRHGIVTKNKGLSNPNHYLSVAVFYLPQHRPDWNKKAALAKLVLSWELINRIAAIPGKMIYYVPIGFK